MNDTRETIIGLPVCTITQERIAANNENGNDVPPDKRPKCRFKIGDTIVTIRNGEIRKFVVENEPYWDREFGGWLLSRGLIGVHESNFVHESEFKEWEFHANNLWSWWTKK